MPEQEYLTVEHLSTKELTRIFSKIEVDKISGCWNWIASLNNYGYGQLSYRRGTQLAHRVLYAWLIAPLPKGRRGQRIPVLDHVVCNNTRCCYPLHVKLGTQRENVLRADTTSGVNSRKTHCVRGHLLPSTPNRVNGSRRCKPCSYADSAKWVRSTEERYQRHLQYHRDYNKRKKAQKLLLNPKP